MRKGTVEIMLASSMIYAEQLKVDLSVQHKSTGISGGAKARQPIPYKKMCRKRKQRNKAAKKSRRCNRR